jgi:hypothetical protein
MTHSELSKEPPPPAEGFSAGREAAKGCSEGWGAAECFSGGWAAAEGDWDLAGEGSCDRTDDDVRGGTTEALGAAGAGPTEAAATVGAALAEPPPASALGSEGTGAGIGAAAIGASGIPAGRDLARSTWGA